ncbi:glycosyltransferase [Swingsia samuiensis]|uniref:Glycosyltransferase n=1 Tax=Swingsia samuiensis TaxID=1293412 RepID=A0A4Y6UJR1_9PROT|nr:glycosyltransferase [Swingsia samuiensis]QDH17802.1 glycosyltransferase [Swingsia samuiensis]
MLLKSVFASVVAWVYLIFFRGFFWQKGPILERKKPPKCIPDVAIVVPARDEAESIFESISSLLKQHYDGKLSVILVDDQSTDGTADIARTIDDPHQRLTIITSQDRPSGWSGKLWAVHQGAQEALKHINSDGYILLTDADIIHDPDHLGSLLTKAREDNLDLVSEMVTLNCISAAERFLVPAFVYFFAMLYPFASVANRKSHIAGAAGGTILIHRPIFEQIGGIESIRGALIDDCTLAAHVKRAGGRLYLGHSNLAWSVRPYEGMRDIWHMIARTAYVQLRYSPFLLLLTLLGMSLIWFVPVLSIMLGCKNAKKAGIFAYCLSCLTFLPTLKRFNLSFWRSLPLPVVAAFYMAATIGSAINHHRGVGVRWKSRSYTGETT